MQISVEMINTGVIILSALNTFFWFVISRELKMVRLEVKNSQLQFEQRLVTERTQELLRLSESRVTEIAEFREWIEDHYTQLTDLQVLLRRMEKAEESIRLIAYECPNCPATLKV